MQSLADSLLSSEQYDLEEVAQDLAGEPKDYPSYVAILRIQGKLTISPEPKEINFGGRTYSYTGEVDEEGNANGYGMAIDTSEKQAYFSGTFRDNIPYGIVVKHADLADGDEIILAGEWESVDLPKRFT